MAAGFLIIAGAIAATVLASCDRKSKPSGAVAPGKAALKHDNEEPYDGPFWFEEVTKSIGIDFTYRNGEDAGHFAIIESLGGGIAIFDFDGDGLFDVFVVGGGYYKGTTVLGHPGRLYRNLGNWKFEDVTAKVELDKPGSYSHGVAVADVDRDGFPDLLITGYNRLTLYMNRSDGKGGRKFVDETEKSGLTERMWSTGAAFADLDGDGYPDLYVCHYGDWGFETNHPLFCAYDGVTRDVCPPKRFKALPHKIYRNKRNGTFEDVSDSLQLRNDGKGLNVLILDINGDGKPDLYVANDTDPNFLYINRTKLGESLKFEEIGGYAGVALDSRAVANGSMGLDAGDPLRTGKPALFVTNYEGELHALYSNDSEPFNPKNPGQSIRFDYESNRNGLASLAPAPLMVGWGAAFCDFDRDGWEDLFIVHGHAIRFPTSGAGRPQFAKLLRNDLVDGKRSFAKISMKGGPYFREKHNSRGSAMGDLNNDGKPDLIVSHINEPVSVLKNTVPTDNHWIGLELSGEKARDIIGATIVIECGTEKYTRWTRSGGNFASANDPRFVVGIAKATKVDKVTVTWPWGKSQEWKNLNGDRYWKLTENDANAR